MTLGGLETGVSPLEMAYAYSTLGARAARRRHDGQRPRPAARSDAIANVTIIDDEEATRSRTRRGLGRERDPDRAGARRDRLRHGGRAARSVVSSGTGEAAATGALRVGQDGNDRRQRRRVVRRRHRGHHRRGVGRARGQQHADGDRVRRRAGRRRHLPGRDLARRRPRLRVDRSARAARRTRAPTRSRPLPRQRTRRPPSRSAPAAGRAGARGADARGPAGAVRAGAAPAPTPAHRAAAGPAQPAPP